MRHNWGAEQVYYHDSAGKLRVMPVAWTSLNSEDPVIVFGAGCSPFRLADLLELCRLINAIKCTEQEQLGEPQTSSERLGGVK